MFLCHYCYEQIGGSRGNDQLPLNILRRGPLTYYSISYNQHNNFYNFFSSEIIKVFLNSVYSKYKPEKKNKIQGYFEIINQQRGDLVTVQDTRVWLTDTITAKYFNGYVKNEINNAILKRIIVNGQTGCSWFFKQFKKLTVIVSPETDVKIISN